MNHFSFVQKINQHSNLSLQCMRIVAPPKMQKKSGNLLNNLSKLEEANVFSKVPKKYYTY